MDPSRNPSSRLLPSRHKPTPLYRKRKRASAQNTDRKKKKCDRQMSKVGIKQMVGWIAIAMKEDERRVVARNLKCQNIRT